MRHFVLTSNFADSCEAAHSEGSNRVDPFSPSGGRAVRLSMLNPGRPSVGGDSTSGLSGRSHLLVAMDHGKLCAIALACHTIDRPIQEERRERRTARFDAILVSFTGPGTAG